VRINTHFENILVGTAAVSLLAKTVPSLQKRDQTQEKIKEFITSTDFFYVIGYFALLFLLYKFVVRIFSTEAKDFLINLNKQIESNPPAPLTTPVMDERINNLNEVLLIPQNESIKNVIFIGEPGVGKSATVYEQVRRIVFDPNFNPKMKKFTFYGLSFKSLVSGTMFRGQLEGKIQKIQEFMLKHKENAALFMDEFHQINTDKDSMNKFNIADNLKELLVSGVRVIGATTLKEYVEYICVDEAFADRFWVIYLNPLSENEIIDALLNIKKRYEEHHMTFDKPEIEYLVSQLRSQEGRFPRKAIKFLDRLNSYILLKHNPTENIKITEEMIDDSIKAWYENGKSSVNYSYYI